MKKMFNFRNLAILCLAFGLVVSLTRCKKYDDDVNSLQTQINALKADVKKDFDEKVNVDIANLKKQLDANVAKLEALEGSSTSSTDVDAKIAAVKQELVNTLVSVETFNTFKTMVEGKIESAATKEELANVTTNINSLEGRVAALEGASSVASGNSQALEDFKAKYATEYQGLKDDISELANKVAANETEIANLKKELATKASQSDFDALKTKVDNFLAKKLDVSVAALTGRLSGLVLVPEYVADNGGALPILNFSPIRTKACGDIVPAVMVKYMVNPSNATEDQIDKANLKFYYNDPKVAKSNNTVDQKAEFVSLEDGVLTVKATLNTAKLWASQKSNPDNRIDQLMLQVPLTDGNVINSDWAKVTFKPEAPAIVKIPKKEGQAADPWKLYELKPFVNAAEASKADDSVKEGVVVDDTAKDYTVVDMVYDQDLDLMKHVQAMYRYLGEDNLEANLNLDAYDLEFAFDLKNAVTGKDIVYNLGKNNTNQQEFINLKGSVVSTRVYSINSDNKASIGRTPIVHVMLREKKGDKCVVKDGYIKLNIVDKIIPPVPPVVYKSKVLEAGCGNQEANRIGTEKMNVDFYGKVNMSKEEFHKNYTFEQLPLDSNDPTNVGTIEQVLDPGDKQSYNLTYTLSEDEVWANIGKTVWAEATYTYGTSVIKIKFETPITKETVKLNLALDNYWFDGYEYTRQNVAVPEKGSENPAECTWVNSIDNAFRTIDKADTQYASRIGLLDLPSQANGKYKDYTYEYVFDTTQPLNENEDLKKEGITLSVSADQKQLLAAKGGAPEVIAEILPQKAGTASTDGDPLEYKQDSELGKYLLNKTKEFMTARVVLVLKNTCDRVVNVEIKNLPMKDRFDIHFLRPINVKGESPENFVDGVDFKAKGSYIDINEVVELSDWRNYIKDTEDYNFLPNHKNYYKYYDVTNIALDTDKIVVDGLQVGGEPLTKLPNTIEVKQTQKDEVFEGVTYPYGRLTYKNNGNNLDKDFTMMIPVIVTYKWGEVSTKVSVKVKATKTQNP